MSSQRRRNMGSRSLLALALLATEFVPSSGVKKLQHSVCRSAAFAGNSVGSKALRWGSCNAVDLPLEPLTCFRMGKSGVGILTRRSYEAAVECSKTTLAAVPGEYSFEGDTEEPEEVAAIGSSLPTLGRLEIAEVEPNVPAPSRRSRLEAFKSRLGLRGLRTGGRTRRKRGLAKPAAGIGAAIGFMAMGPFGAVIGAVASAFATRRDGPAGSAVRTTARAAGMFSLCFFCVGVLLSEAI